MSTFKFPNKVFCPALSNKPFIVFDKPNTNGVFLIHRGVEYWFTVDGVTEERYKFNISSAKTLPSLHMANIKNRDLLSKLYDTEFTLAGEVKMFAVMEDNIDTEGEVAWLAESSDLGKYYEYIDWSEELTPRQMWDRNIIVSLSPEGLESEKTRGNQSVVCIGWDDIDNWFDNNC